MRRLRRLGAAALLGVVLIVVAAACSSFDNATVDGNVDGEAGLAEAAVVDATLEDAAVVDASDASLEDAPWECDGSLVTWDFDTTDPPSPLHLSAPNYGVDFTQVATDAGHFGRFTESFAGPEAGSIYRINLTVPDSFSDVCMSMRIRHEAFGPSDVTIEEIAAAMFTLDSSLGFAQVLQTAQNAIVVADGFSADGGDASFGQSTVLAGNAMTWVTWRAEIHHEAVGLRFRLFQNGRKVLDGNPFPSNAGPVSGSIGFGPYSSSPSPDAGPAIIDYANVRIDQN